MSDKKDGGPAFPGSSFTRLEGDRFAMNREGMSLRDWFAGQALITLKLSGHRGSESWFAETAYAQADAMIAAGRPTLNCSACGVNDVLPSHNCRAPTPPGEEGGKP